MMATHATQATSDVKKMARLEKTMGVVPHANPATPNYAESVEEEPAPSKKRKGQGGTLPISSTTLVKNTPNTNFLLVKNCKGVSHLNGADCCNVVFTDVILCPSCKAVASNSALTTSVSRSHAKKTKQQYKSIQHFLATQPRP